VKGYRTICDKMWQTPPHKHFTYLMCDIVISSVRHQTRLLLKVPDYQILVPSPFDRHVCDQEYSGIAATD
jgi:hypothetical protein